MGVTGQGAVFFAVHVDLEDMGEKAALIKQPFQDLLSTEIESGGFLSP